MTPAQIEEITQLRSRKVSPKQIARKLGLRPAEVTAIIKQQSEAGHIQQTLPELKAILINESAAQHLLERSSKKGLFGRKKGEADRNGNGLTQVFLLRVDEKNRHWVSSYLIDYWCLGVKDTFGPRQVTRKQYDDMLWQTEDRFEEKLQEITLEQAQAIVFGAVDYAKGLGLEPHSDFRRSRAHLGPRPETLMTIEFGKDGMPYFITGPYDDSVKVIKTLRETVGEGNFHYIAGLDSLAGDFF